MTPLATFLDGTAPTRLRGLAWLALSDTGNVLSLSGSDDGGGGSTSTFTAGSDIACRIDPLGGGEGLAGERISDRSTHLITVPASATVTTSDRFSIDSLGTFEITAVRSRTHETIRRLEVVPV